MKLLVLLSTFTVIFATEIDFEASNKIFTATFYKKISKNVKGNFLVSPLSTQTILALTQAGCKGQSAREIRSALNFTDDPKQIQSTFEKLSLSSNKYTVRTANKIYVKDGFPIRDEFQRACKPFGAEVQNIDFNKRNRASEAINTWVQNKSNDTIRNLVSPSNFNDRTRVVLVNALYFKANWSKPFPIAYTRKLSFSISRSENVSADMMLLHETNFNYYECQALKATFLELPFKGGNASMVVVLPDDVDGLPLIEAQMKKVLKPRRFSRHSFNVILPRFRIETSVDLKKILKNMNVTSIFDDKYADLSGIAGEEGDLVVDKVAQKSFIDVSEEGVEAAAATYVLIAVPMSAPSEPPKKFRADRPFLFYIQVKGVVVFVGRVTNPLKLN